MKRLSILAIVLLLTGCGHYRITDPSTNKVYYTHDLTRPSVWTGSGAATFTDDISGKHINIQNYEAERITKEEWQRATGKQ